MENTDPGLDVYAACKAGDVERVVHLIDVKNFPVNKLDENNRTGK